MEKHTYNLEKLKRLLNFPFRLKEIGWMPEHVYIVNPAAFTCPPPPNTDATFATS